MSGGTSVLSETEQLHVEGAKNLWRYHHRDLYQVFWYVGICVALFVASWLFVHLVVLIPHPNPAPTYYGHLRLPKMHVPVYRPTS